MPEPYDREGLIDRATDAINGGKPTLALEIAEEIRKGEGPNADEALIRGIALSSLGRTAEASDAFAEATRRAPTSHKARFNAAVHEFNAGNVQGAKSLAAEAAALDPTHGGTRKLVEKIEAQLTPTPDEPPSVTSPAYAVYANPEGQTIPDNELESLPWVGKLGQRWVWIAIVISAIGFLACVATTAIMIRLFPTFPKTVALADMMAGMQRDSSYITANLVSGIAGFGTFLWTLLDLVRRKGNFLWLMGIVPCSCFSFGWLILPIYLLFGRKA